MTDANNRVWATYLHGQQVGDYVLGDLLGGGAFSMVLEARNVNTNTNFAAKILSPSRQSGSDTLDFEQEGRLLTRLVKCSNVINLVDSGSQIVTVAVPTGSPLPVSVNYHVLTQASGSLQDLLLAPEALDSISWQERMEIWRGIVLGVHQMHLKGVAHRDLKVDNCLLMASGNKVEVRLTDLGRSRDLRVGPRGLPLEYVRGRGDLAVAPPEFIYCQGENGKLDCKHADLYGLGSMLFEMVTGQPITAATLGPVQARAIIVQQELNTGHVRDLATLRPVYDYALLDFAERVPSVIRHESTALVRQLTDPVASARQPRRGLGRRAQPDNGLLWLLHRADILIRRITTAPRRKHQPSPSNSFRSA